MSFDFGKGTSRNTYTSNLNSNTNTSANNSTSATSTPIAPDGYQSFWNSVQPGAGGFGATQQNGVNWFQNSLNSGDPANLNPSRAMLGTIGQRQYDTSVSRTNPTLRNLRAIDPTAYATPADVSADTITAKRGLDFLKDYQTPLTSDYVNASLNDYDQGAAEARNALRAGNAGAFGNKRTGVAEGQFASDSALGRGQLSSGLRMNAFNTAAGLGMQDAGRFLTADQTNAANRLAASQFNAGQAQARNMFDAQQGLAYNAQQDQLMRDAAATQGQAAGVGATAFNANQGLARGLFDAGTTGYAQNLAWLAAGSPLFGTNNTSTSNSTSTSATNANQSGTSQGRTTNAGLGFDISPFSIFSPAGG